VIEYPKIATERVFFSADNNFGMFFIENVKRYLIFLGACFAMSDCKFVQFINVNYERRGNEVPSDACRLFTDRREATCGSPGKY
jgi:hypothetical protein